MIQGIKNYLAAGVALFSVGAALAAPVGKQEARDVAASFMAEHRSMYRMPASEQPSLAYTAKEGETVCYYVFNAPGDSGFTIVAADDRLPKVIGFGQSGAFDYELAPDNMKWWLGEYAGEIAAYIAADPQGESEEAAFGRKEDYATVLPLLSTKWDQGIPYNDLCPIDRNYGQRSVTGCVATAMAQVMAYHKWPKNPTGSHGGEVFEGTTFDWDNMLDEYEAGKYNSTQSKAVAWLMRCCGASVDMQYSAWESGAYSCDVQVALRTYFDYNASMQMLWRDYYKMSDWNDIVYKEVSSGRPVYYSGRSERGGHAFVCDGYMGGGFFHFNWGWGGYQDGYFLLNALNPQTGGTGSYAGGYNSDQSIITGVAPSKGEKNLQYLMIATGDFYYTGNDTYEIKNSTTNQNMIYNPLGYRQQFTFGLKITDMDNPSKVTYAKASSASSYESYYGTSELKIALPGTIADGRYKISPAMYTQLNEWVDVPVPYACQRWVTLEVTGGKRTFLNEGAIAARASNVLPGIPQFPEPFYGNAGKAMKLTLVNTGEEDYSGTVYLSLYNDNGLFDYSIDEGKKVFVPASSSIEVEYTSPEYLEPGSYTAYISYVGEDYMCESISVGVIEGDFPAMSMKDIEVTEVLPVFHQADEPYGIVMGISNRGNGAESVVMTIKVVDAKTQKQVKAFRTGQVTVEGGGSTNINFAPMDLGLAPGQYLWMICDGDNLLGQPQPLVVERGPVVSNGIGYTITSDAEKTARLVAPALSEYEGKVVVPEEISGYRLTEMSSDAFAFAEDATSVTLPSGISDIPSGSFYNAKLLRTLTINREEPPMLWPDAFAPGAETSIVLSVPKGSGNLYHSWDAWSAFTMSNWTIYFGEDCELLGGLDMNPLTGKYYTPYYIGADERLTFEVGVPEGRAVRAVYSIEGSKFENKDSQRVVKLPPLNGKSGQVWLSHIDGSGVEAALAESGVVDVYNTVGLKVLSDATKEEILRLPSGIYIAGGKKIVVK